VSGPGPGRPRFRAPPREEAANALLHGAGALLSLAGGAVLVARSRAYRDAAHTAAVGVSGASLVGVFAASTLYHAVTAPRLKPVTRWLDQACIYAAIAGTYTPFMLTALKGATGLAVLSAVWALAAVGIVAKALRRLRSDAVSLPLYLLMGWLIVAVLPPLARHFPPAGLGLLVAGGLCSSLGVGFFRWRRPYAHAVWHGCVLAGGALHSAAYAAVLRYATPP
jgi:hemolysin III